LGTLQRLAGSPRGVVLIRSFITACVLSLVFVVIYGGTNWFTAQRPATHIGTWFFAWELGIPFVPWLIIPYMSIDLFFFFAPFLCRSDRERWVFAQRVVFSIAVAVAFFLLIPLRLVWPTRPAVEGWFGQLVEASCTAPFLMEYPHNLFPSLHVVFCALLTDHYSRHTRGVVRVVIQIWFALITISTVLTWQHHLVDVAGGAILAVFAFHLFREQGVRSSGAGDRQLALRYALGAVTMLMVSPLLGYWGVFLLWPVAALTHVAWGYFNGNPGVYRKLHGVVSRGTLWALGPVWLGQWLSWWYYRQQCRAVDRVTPQLLIGGCLRAQEAEVLVQQGVLAVLDLTAEFSEQPALRRLAYRNIPVLDLTAPTQEQLQEAAAFLTHHTQLGLVYVHCKVGYSRTAAVVGAYLLANGVVKTAEDAVARLRAVRPTLVIRPEALSALRLFASEQDEARLHQTMERWAA
jgi:protein-tyrosine phosphatase/membrane-associated phospholipid phosphatase